MMALVPIIKTKQHRHHLFQVKILGNTKQTPLNLRIQY